MLEKGSNQKNRGIEEGEEARSRRQATNIHHSLHFAATEKEPWTKLE